LDVRNLISRQVALEFGKLLLKWGFIMLPKLASENSRFSKTVARYIGGAAQAMAKSVIETRAALEKEEHASATATTEG
jgi:hypothetical protein